MIADVVISIIAFILLAIFMFANKDAVDDWVNSFDD